MVMQIHPFLPPANIVCEGYVFTPVCDSVNGGACVVAQGGMRGCSGGAYVVALGGCVWLLKGGMRGCSGGVCMVAPGGMRGIRRDTEIRSMSGRYASYWNAFLSVFVFATPN